MNVISVFALISIINNNIELREVVILAECSKPLALDMTEAP